MTLAQSVALAPWPMDRIRTLAQGFPAPTENAHTAWLMRANEAGTLAA